MKKCVFAGTFDPFTVGHSDTVEKCLKIFDEVIVAVAENRTKSCLFPSDLRAEMIKRTYENEDRVRCVVWDKTIVELLKEENTPFYVRGIRNAIDLDYENADFYASRDLSGDMITVYIPSEQKHLHVSSSLVKNCIAFNQPYAQYVPEAVYRIMQKGKTF